eukprot:913090-Heterocapsa_arctica.AAC.1
MRHPRQPAGPAQGSLEELPPEELREAPPRHPQKPPGLQRSRAGHRPLDEGYSSPQDPTIGFSRRGAPLSHGWQHRVPRKGRQ